MTEAPRAWVSGLDHCLDLGLGLRARLRIGYPFWQLFDLESHPDTVNLYDNQMTVLVIENGPVPG